MKKLIFIIFITLLLVCCNKHQTADIVFFYSYTCPHCEKVIAFFKAEDVRNKINFKEKEVSENRNNAMELIKIQDHCHIGTPGYIQVPLLWTGEKCITGDQDIIKFFKEKIRK